jgi:hypothetical protein
MYLKLLPCQKKNAQSIKLPVQEMFSQVAPCVRQIGSSISSVFVNSILYELDVKLRDEVALVGCFVGEVDDDEPCSYRNKLCEETFYDLCLNQRSSHSKVLSTNSQRSTASPSNHQQSSSVSIRMPECLRILRQGWRVDKKSLVWASFVSLRCPDVGSSVAHLFCSSYLTYQQDTRYTHPGKKPSAY